MILVIDQPNIGAFMDYSSSLATYVVSEFYHVAYKFYLDTTERLGYNPDFEMVHGLMSGELDNILNEYNVYDPSDDWVCTCEDSADRELCDGTVEIDLINQAIYDMFDNMMDGFIYSNDVLNAYLIYPDINFYVSGWDIVFASTHSTRASGRIKTDWLIELPVVNKHLHGGLLSASRLARKRA